MLLEELLFEMPKSINAISIDLDNPRSNRRYADLYARDKDRELLKEYPDNVNLYKIGRKIVLIDEDQHQVVYFMEWTEIFHKFVNHKAASQVLVWRDSSKPGYETVAADIFFGYLMDEYGVIITDTLQSPDGRRFWVRRVGDAFRKGLNVYYLNLLPSSMTVNRELIKISSRKEFEDLNREKNFWGDDEKFRARKIIISNIELE